MNEKFEHDFKKIFEALPNHILLLDVSLKIVSATTAYCELTHQKLADITGKYVFDVFPENEETQQSDGLLTLSQSFDMVLDTKKAQTMPALHYDVQLNKNDQNSFKTLWWQVVNTPILNENGVVIYIVNAVEDVTNTMVPSKAANLTS